MHTMEATQAEQSCSHSCSCHVSGQQQAASQASCVISHILSQGLRSVREALATPRLYMTAFQIKADELVVPKRRVVPAAAARELPLGADEIIVRVDVREFDVVHQTHQAGPSRPLCDHAMSLPSKLLQKLYML